MRGKILKNWRDFLKSARVFLRETRGYEFFDRRFAVSSFFAYGKYLRRWRLTAGKNIAERYLFAVCSVPYLPEVSVCRVSFPIFAEGHIFAGYFSVSLRQIDCLPCARRSDHGKQSSARQIALFP
jgi:hypothetical protein